jgi:hypothetical protein
MIMIAALALAASLLNPAVHPDTIAQTICRPGYTKTVRPSTSYVRIWKRLNLKAGVDPRSVVVDHIVPLELGGNPLAPNLQLQKKAEAHRKDLAENRQHRAVCSGRVFLRDAQAQMAGWPRGRPRDRRLQGHAMAQDQGGRDHDVQVVRTDADPGGRFAVGVGQG